MTVGDLRAAIVDVPDDTLVYVDDLLVDTPGSSRDKMLTVLLCEFTDKYAIGSPDGPRVRDFKLIVEDSDYASIGKPVAR